MKSIRVAITIVFVALAFGLVSLLVPAVAQAQCPMWKGALASGTEDANRLSNAMNWSILVMLVAPYLLFAGICGLMYRAIRKARREQTAAEQSGSNTSDPPIEPGANDTA